MWSLPIHDTSPLKDYLLYPISQFLTRLNQFPIKLINSAPIVLTSVNQGREGGLVDIGVVAEIQTYMGEVVKTISVSKFTASTGSDGVFDVLVNVEKYIMPYVAPDN